MQTIEINKKNRTPLVVASSVQEEDPYLDLFWKHKEVIENSNPIPIPENTQFKFLKKLIGKLIRTYTRKQVHFNLSTTSFMELTIKHFKLVNQRQKDLAQEIKGNLERDIKKNIDNANKASEANFELRLNNLEEVLMKKYELELSRLEKKIDSYIESTNNELTEIKNAQAEKSGNLSQWLSALEGNIGDSNKWIGLIDGRLKNVEGYQERTRKEIFAELKNSNVSSFSEKENKTVEPKIINEEKVSGMIAEGIVKVNLGSGSLVKADYINIDMRPLEGVDIVSDVRNVPLDDESVDELYLAHVIEHFSEIDMEKFILPYWHKLLKVNGKIRIVCPNWEAMLSGYSQGTISFEVLKEITFGSQEYEGNQHYNMFSPASLVEMMRKIGFSEITIISESRQNGLCLEMEIEGVR